MRLSLTPYSAATAAGAAAIGADDMVLDAREGVHVGKRHGGHSPSNWRSFPRCRQRTRADDHYDRRAGT